MMYTYNLCCITYSRIDSCIVRKDVDLAIQDPLGLVPHQVPAVLVRHVELDEVDAGNPD